MMMIPFVDLNAQYQSIKSEIDNAINECIDEGIFIKGRLFLILRVHLQIIWVQNIVWVVETEPMLWK